MRLDESIVGFSPLGEARSWVADQGSRLSPLHRTDLKVLVTAIESRLEVLIGLDTRDPLNDAIRHALLAPGKRIRPLLTMLSAGEVGLDPNRVVDLGCALEMVHAASLALDDLPAMDDAALRRGQASTHAAHGEDMAILASVSLLSRAFGVVAETPCVPSDRRGSIVSLLARVIGPQGLTGGQSRDLRARNQDRDRLADANDLKTGALFVATVEMPCLLGGVGSGRLGAMRRFARHFGQAFQIADDLADSHAENGLPGEDENKATLVNACGRDEALHLLHAHLSQALDEISPSGDLAVFVAELFEASAATRPRPPTDGHGRSPPC